MWVTVMQCSLPAFCRALSLRAAVPKALQANEAWKGRWGLDQGKIAWPSDRICLVTHSLFLIDAHQGWTRGRRLRCVCACARAYMSACIFIAMRFEIPVLIQDANSSDSIINIMYRDRTHTSTHTHAHTHEHTDCRWATWDNNPNVFRKLFHPGRENRSLLFLSGSGKHGDTLTVLIPAHENSLSSSFYFYIFFYEETFPLRHVYWSFSQLLPNEAKARQA